jgi:hypothetical protein
MISLKGPPVRMDQRAFPFKNCSSIPSYEMILSLTRIGASSFGKPEDAYSGQSQAAPRTPLASPCLAGKIGVSASLPKTYSSRRAGTFL